MDDVHHTEHPLRSLEQEMRTLLQSNVRSCYQIRHFDSWHET